MLVISVTNQSRIRAAIVVVYVNMASVSRFRKRESTITQP